MLAGDAARGERGPTVRAMLTYNALIALFLVYLSVFNHGVA